MKMAHEGKVRNIDTVREKELNDRKVSIVMGNQAIAFRH